MKQEEGKEYCLLTCLLGEQRRKQTAECMRENQRTCCLNGRMDTVVECRELAELAMESTWSCPRQGTGLSDSLGWGQSGKGFCHSPLGNSVGGSVLCHIVCSQCCKLAQQAYSGVRDKSKEVSVQRQRWDTGLGQTVVIMNHR